MPRQGPKRSEVQREQDKATIARMILQGKTHQEIANFLELDRSMISREVKLIRDEWKASSLRDFDEARGERIAELELVKAELWESWQQSKQQKQTTLKEQIDSLDGGTDEGEKRTKVATRHQSATGDAIYLSGVVNCIKEQSKLLGLYPQEGTGTGQAISLTDGQLGVLGKLMGDVDNGSTRPGGGT